VDAADYPRYLAANAQVYQLLGLRLQPDASWWRRARDWLDLYWLVLIVGTAGIGTLTAVVWAWVRRR
jgi:hypothetical protein